jgi:hypothetical protein
VYFFRTIAGGINRTLTLNWANLAECEVILVKNKLSATMTEIIKAEHN